MPGIMSVFELLQNVLLGKPQALKFALPGSFRWRHRHALRAGLFGSVRLLGLNRFAFPASCHGVIIIRPGLLFSHGRSRLKDSASRAVLPSLPGCRLIPAGHAPRATALE